MINYARLLFECNKNGFENEDFQAFIKKSQLLLIGIKNNMSDIVAKVKSIIADKLNIEESKITGKASFIDDLGADSLDLAEVVLALESEFDCEIPDEVVEKITTLDDAVEYIQKNCG